MSDLPGHSTASRNVRARRKRMRIVIAAGHGRIYLNDLPFARLHTTGKP